MVWDLLRRLIGGSGAANIGSGEQVTASDGGTAIIAGGDVSVVGEQHIHATPPPPPVPEIDWWLRDGAPSVESMGVILGRHESGPYIEGDFRLTRQVQELRLRVFGSMARGEWEEPSRTGRNRGDGSQAYHLGHHRLDLSNESDDVPLGEVRVELCFWWGGDERHMLWGGPVELIPKQRLPLLARW
jgi:hypothetical protein